MSKDDFEKILGELVTKVDNLTEYVGSMAKMEQEIEEKDNSGEDTVKEVSAEDFSSLFD